MSKVISLQSLSAQQEEPDVQGSYFACSEYSFFICA